MATKQMFFKFYRKKHPDFSSCIAAVIDENKFFKKLYGPFLWMRFNELHKCHFAPSAILLLIYQMFGSKPSGPT